MRLWSIHPKYLDSKGLVALWREGLLAKKVLEGKTKGYTNHPQLDRFKIMNDPVKSINYYLTHVYNEAHSRAYTFDKSKINTMHNKIEKIPISDLQKQYEYELLKKKLNKRDAVKHSQLATIRHIELHPLFYTVRGQIEVWEKVIPEIETLVSQHSNDRTFIKEQ
ncbi:MAG TPA: pyrimidine dimer DNA glycosylase/endonuclease V [Treponemataceae bacterium]|nr:pyrimidine dimer DNA glycosylase/endonuclease V [Treponemataceae bacterium]